jgi:lysophospholipase L1-like esterase
VLSNSIIINPGPTSLIHNPLFNTAIDLYAYLRLAIRRFWNISLAAIRGEVAKGRRTLVTIQFGHNDMKIAPPESMGSNLTEMVKEVRGLGGEPVLVTPLTRRTFKSDGTVADTLGPWADGDLFC